VLFVEFDDGAMVCGRGPAARASAIFRLDADDCFALLAGRENGHLLYLAGRVEVEGDLSLAGRLGRLFAAE
jgi:predicted lipid carrier protein YhbT